MKINSSNTNQAIPNSNQCSTAGITKAVGCYLRDDAYKTFLAKKKKKPEKSI